VSRRHNAAKVELTLPTLIEQKPTAFTKGPRKQPKGLYSAFAFLTQQRRNNGATKGQAMSFDLSGKTAIITGNSTGLGKAIGLQMGKLGASIPVNFFHNESRAAETVAAYEAAGIRTTAIQADVTTEAGVDYLVSQTERILGNVDVIVLNATCEQPLKTIEEYDWDFYQSMLDFFLKSPFLLTRRVLGSMKQQKSGRIINITSEVFHKAASPFSAYVAAKGAQIGWSRSMSQELAPFGITVNMVAPGWIPVERHESDPQEMKDGYLATIPMQRWGTPDDVAHACCYLASSEANFVTGQTIAVNGGNSAWM
jgi:3-oxoacyl-[acyl-carrier protein] reductase